MVDSLAVQGTLKSLLQHHSSKASIIQCSAFFIVQISHPYMTIGKTIALTRWTFDSKVISLLFNMLSRLVIAFLPRSKRLNLMTAVTIHSDFGTQGGKKDVFFIMLLLLLLLSRFSHVRLCEDWNAKVGSQETLRVTGKFGLGAQSEAGQRLIEFCQENALVIANAFFQQHKRQLYTWTPPDGQYRNQIDSILSA